jgi:hypothetical protein
MYLWVSKLDVIAEMVQRPSLSAVVASLSICEVQLLSYGIGRSLLCKLLEIRLQGQTLTQLSPPLTSTFCVSSSW